MPKLIPTIEAWISSELVAAETELEAIWIDLKPGILALGKTILGQVLTAAEVFVSTGGNAAEAIASVVAQLPADAKAAEALVAGAFAAQVTKLQSGSIAPAATPAAP